jgi:hypothetical protein
MLLLCAHQVNMILKMQKKSFLILFSFSTAASYAAVAVDVTTRHSTVNFLITFAECVYFAVQQYSYSGNIFRSNKLAERKV